MVLYEIYEQSRLSDEVFTVSDEDVNELGRKYASPTFLKNMIYNLHQDGYIYGEYESEPYEITTKGIRFIEEQLFEDDSVLNRIINNSATDDTTTQEAQIPASDRFVPTDHNQELYEQSVSALDEVIREFKDDHGLDNELGGERPALLRSLENAKEIIETKRVRSDVVQALVIRPLELVRAVAVRYEREGIAALATAALTVILKYFGAL